MPHKYDFTRYKTTLQIIILLSIIIFLRAPRVFLEGRIWAEEGNVFFKTAYESGVVSLFTLYAGYLNLFANVCAYVASLLPLKCVGYVFVYASLFVELGVVAYVLLQNNQYLNQWSRFLLVCMLIMSPNSTSELFCNSINMQSWFGVWGLILLFENGHLHSRRIQTISYIVYFMGCLTGVYCLFSVPFVVLRAIFCKIKHKSLPVYWKVLSVIGIVAGCIQAASFLLSRKNMSSARGFEGFDALESLIYAFRFQFILPLLGKNVAAQIGNIGILIFVFSFLAIVILITWLCNKRCVRYVVCVMGVLFFVQILIIAASLNHMAGGRYAFMPAFIVYMLFSILLTVIEYSSITILYHIFLYF